MVDRDMIHNLRLKRLVDLGGTGSAAGSIGGAIGGSGSASGGAGANGIGGLRGSIGADRNPEKEEEDDDTIKSF